MMTKKSINELIYKIVGCAIEVHKELGPGLLESVYQQCLFHELKTQGYRVQKEVVVPVNYKGLEFDTQLRLDLLVNDCIVIELKTVEAIHPVHKAQLLTYMKLLEKPKGLLINFYTDVLKNGISYYVNEHFSALPD